MAHERSSCYALATRLGVTITGGEPGGAGEVDIQAEAPAGQTWKCEPGLHVLVAATWNGEPSAAVWHDLWERMSLGLETESADAARLWNE